MDFFYLIRISLLSIVFFCIGLHQLITKRLFFGYSRKYTEESMQKFARISGILIMIMAALALVNILNHHEYLTLPGALVKISMVCFIIMAIAFTLLFMTTVKMRPAKELQKMKEKEEAEARAKAKRKAAKKGGAKVAASKSGYSNPNPVYTPKRSSKKSKR